MIDIEVWLLDPLFVPAFVLGVFLPTDLLPSLVWPVLTRSTEEYWYTVVCALVVNARETVIGSCVGRHWL